MVGTKPAGSGKWGHADLAGNVGEWVLDYWTLNLPTPCVDCAILVPDAHRFVRGGAFNSTSGDLVAKIAADLSPDTVIDATGIRCARD